MENPPKKFFRLAPGREVRLRYAYFIKCGEVVKDAAGEVVELRCTYDPATRGGDAPDGRKVKATLHWVSAAHAIDAEVRLYDRLFADPDPDAGDFAATQPRTRWKCSERARSSRPRRPERRPARSVRAPGLFLPRPGFPPRRARCSTAPSGCATPGPRSRVRGGKGSAETATCPGPAVAFFCSSSVRPSAAPEIADGPVRVVDLPSMAQVEEDNLKRFISWSEKRSEALASALREWLPLVLHYVEPWLSKSDIQAGERWSVEIAKELESCTLRCHLCDKRRTLALLGYRSKREHWQSRCRMGELCRFYSIWT